MRLTICCETLFPDLPLTERFAPIRALGVDSLELWGLAPCNVAAVEAALRCAPRSAGWRFFAAIATIR